MFHLTPSTIARYFFQDCERYLRYRAAPRGERESIEAALIASRGRVAGPSGAAAKLRIPASTLEARIKALNIHKSEFKFR